MKLQDNCPHLHESIFTFSSMYSCRSCVSISPQCNEWMILPLSVASGQTPSMPCEQNKSVKMHELSLTAYAKQTQQLWQNTCQTLSENNINHNWVLNG